MQIEKKVVAPTHDFSSDFFLSENFSFTFDEMNRALHEIKNERCLQFSPYLNKRNTKATT
jgi:hypothetical protein